MARAWTYEWMLEQQQKCQADAEFQEEADGYDRTTVLHILADPERGVEKDHFVGFNPPSMTEVWAAEENKDPDADYLIEGTYQDWWAVNEGKKGLVASLLDQSILLRAGKTSYIAMFVPGVDRFFTISRSCTDSYDGDYKPER
jgi:hypothetical protein